MNPVLAEMHKEKRICLKSTDYLHKQKRNKKIVFLLNESLSIIFVSCRRDRYTIERTKYKNYPYRWRDPLQFSHFYF